MDNHDLVYVDKEQKKLFNNTYFDIATRPVTGNLNQADEAGVRGRGAADVQASKEHGGGAGAAEKWRKCPVERVFNRRVTCPRTCIVS